MLYGIVDDIIIIGVGGASGAGVFLAVGTSTSPTTKSFFCFCLFFEDTDLIASMMSALAAAETCYRDDL